MNMDFLQGYATATLVFAVLYMFGIIHIGRRQLWRMKYAQVGVLIVAAQQSMMARQKKQDACLVTGMKNPM